MAVTFRLKVWDDVVDIGDQVSFSTRLAALPTTRTHWVVCVHSHCFVEPEGHRKGRATGNFACG